MSTEPTVNGIVTESLPATLFRLKLDDGREVLGHLAGKMRLNHIRVMAGDRVTVILSPDGDKARIVRRG